jgi:hypothetical protein
MPAADFDHWFKAYAFLIEGKGGFAELDIRVTNAFVFLEMLDESGSFDAVKLAEMLNISRSDGHLIRETRNRLIHERHTLNHAVRDADAKRERCDPKQKLSSILM